MTKRGPQKKMKKSEIFDRSIKSIVMINEMMDLMDVSKMSKEQFFVYDTLLTELDNIIKSVQNSDGTFKFKNHRV